MFPGVSSTTRTVAGGEHGTGKRGSRAALLTGRPVKSSIKAPRLPAAGPLAPPARTRYAPGMRFLPRLCEWNVAAQVRTLGSLPTVTAAWERGQELVLHGWIYDLRDGLLRDLQVSVDRPCLV